MTLPIGLRLALAQKRNIELRLMKARAVLAASELEITHELGNTFGQIDATYQMVETSYDRMVAAKEQMNIARREEDAGRLSVDLRLRSEANYAAAETSYYTALIRYNQAVTDLRLRKGTLLEENNIFLEEGEWTREAQQEALRRAWARSFAKPAERLQESPEPVEAPYAGAGGYYVAPGSEVLPTPDPEPNPIPISDPQSSEPAEFDFEPAGEDPLPPVPAPDAPHLEDAEAD
jgi:hypothetical protein